MSSELRKLVALVALVLVGTAVAVGGYVRSLDPESLAAAVRVEPRRAGVEPRWDTPPCVAPLECPDHRAGARRT